MLEKYEWWFSTALIAGFMLFIMITITWTELQKYHHKESKDEPKLELKMEPLHPEILPEEIEPPATCLPEEGPIEVGPPSPWDKWI